VAVRFEEDGRIASTTAWPAQHTAAHAGEPGSYDDIGQLIRPGTDQGVHFSRIGFGSGSN
jgi:hypothetical protein